uniref:Nucleolar protein 14-like n=1 Tax=Hirondellea gigas TaxID=1518452 RepID=A0A2P2I4L6_9CRUS
MKMGKRNSHKSKKESGANEHRTQSVNPFSLHHNRSKFTILGQSKKGTKGLPGISRHKATDNRSKTLLVEYMNRNKSNVFIDRRLGERDSAVNEDQKMDLRRLDELRRTHNKYSMYNLSETTEDLLTHGGVALTDDNINLAISDDEELDEDGMLDAKFVKEQHFGGVPALSSSSGGESGESGTLYKSEKDRIDEIIAESKKRKLESKLQKEEQKESFKELDDQFSHFMKLMSGNLMTVEESRKATKCIPLRDYDRLMRTLDISCDKTARPCERLKTSEEIATQKSEALDRLETERLARMKGNFQDLVPKFNTRSVDSLDNGLLEEFAAAAGATTTGSILQYKDGKLLLGGLEHVPGSARRKLSREDKKKLKKQAKLEKKMREEEERLQEEIGESSDDDDMDEEDEVNSAQEADEEDEEDNYSDIMSSGGEESDAGSQDHGSEVEHDDENQEVVEENICTTKSKGSKKKSRESLDDNEEQMRKGKKKIVSFAVEEDAVDDIIRSRLVEQATKELPYTFDVPRNFEGFWSLLQGRSPADVSTIISRMIACNHPQLKHANRLKCSDIFSYILQTVQVLCEPISPDCPNSCEYNSLRYLDSVVPHLFTLTQLQPEDAAKALLLVFIEKRDEYRDKLKKRYPFLDTLIFVQISGLLFPASDFYHHVMTPVKSFLVQLLGEAKMKDARSVLAALHVATLLHEYTHESSKYCAELLLRLQGLLLRCVPASILSKHDQHTQASNSVPLRWLLSPTLPQHDMLTLQSPDNNKLPAARRFTLSMLNDESLEMTDELRCTVLLVTLKILKDLCQHWALLPSIREIMAPLHTILALIPSHRYPSAVVEMKAELDTALQQMPPHPARLRVDEGRPKPLRMLEPQFQEQKLNSKNTGKKLSQQQILEQKLLHYTKRERKGAQREILKDTSYLARLKLKEEIASDKERKKKVNLIMNELGHQESQHQQYQKMKPGARK